MLPLPGRWRLGCSSTASLSPKTTTLLSLTTLSVLNLFFGTLPLVPVVVCSTSPPPPPTFQQLQPRPSSLICSQHTNSTSSTIYWIQNTCYGGYLGVRGGLVVSEHLDSHVEAGRLKKEICLEHFGSKNHLNDHILIRLYSHEADRFVCYGRQGRLEALRPTEAHKRGPLCTFREIPVPGTWNQVRYQSGFDPSWFLGFCSDYTLIREDPIRGHRIAFPHRMRRGLHPECPDIETMKSCDFKFSTGELVSNESSPQWRGLQEFFARASTRINLKGLPWK